MATFKETRATISIKFVTEQGIVMSKWSKTFENFWLHSSGFVLVKQRKKLNFQRFSTHKRPFGGCFQ